MRFLTCLPGIMVLGATLLTWFAYLVGQAEQKSTLPKSGYVHCGLGKIHRNGGLTLPPSPEQQRGIKRARKPSMRWAVWIACRALRAKKSGSIIATRRTRVLAGNRPGLTPTSWSTTRRYWPS